MGLLASIKSLGRWPQARVANGAASWNLGSRSADPFQRIPRFQFAAPAPTARRTDAIDRQDKMCGLAAVLGPAHVLRANVGRGEVAPLDGRNQGARKPLRCRFTRSGVLLWRMRRIVASTTGSICCEKRPVPSRRTRLPMSGKPCAWPATRGPGRNRHSADLNSANAQGVEQHCSMRFSIRSSRMSL